MPSMDSYAREPGKRDKQKSPYTRGVQALAAGTLNAAIVSLINGWRPKNRADIQALDRQRAVIAQQCLDAEIGTAPGGVTGEALRDMIVATGMRLPSTAVFDPDTGEPYTVKEHMCGAILRLLKPKKGFGILSVQVALTSLAVAAAAFQDSVAASLVTISLSTSSAVATRGLFREFSAALEVVDKTLEDKDEFLNLPEPSLATDIALRGIFGTSDWRNRPLLPGDTAAEQRMHLMRRLSSMILGPVPAFVFVHANGLSRTPQELRAFVVRFVLRLQERLLLVSQALQNIRG